MPDTYWQLYEDQGFRRQWAIANKPVKLLALFWLVLKQQNQMNKCNYFALFQSGLKVCEWGGANG
ncbi:hypothetical protein ACF3DV_06820 [Chlorogloeopsis fritschii PCC 9212]|uniref:hypothetical protein n=1 Tax=Chlorogloeopsis fritschii TaxID=1124 RepID=UPI000F8C991E|nr:hypothetical protein [Chlorogloeopsis fritschii]